MRLGYWAAAGAAAALMIAGGAVAQLAAGAPDPNHPGKAIYQERCAACHDNPGQTRAATFAQLVATSPIQLRMVLAEGGVMAPMAQGLSRQQLGQLIGYLTSGQAAANANWAEALMCAPDNRAVDISAPVAMGGFGGDPRSTRNLSAAQAGLKKSDMASLEVAWAIGFPQTQSMGTGVAVLGDTAFVAAGGRLLALDASRGCARWAQPLNSRNTPQIADLDGRKVLVLTAGRGDVVVVDARDGQLVWRASGLPEKGSGSVRGGVVVYKDKVIVPISASGVGAGMNPKFECCEGHGAVVALSFKDGSRLWEYHTMGEATYNGQVSRAGVKQRGPSGAPIWSLPTIDAKRNRVLVSTGENTSHPATNTSDAVIAIDLDTGKAAWVWQAMPADVWNMACNDRELAKSGPNCPNLFAEPTGRDFDFGATPVLLTVGGRDMVFIGQKSGHAWAVDAATGKLLWSDRIGEGSPLGGVHWGVTTDGALGFVPIADPLYEEAEQAKSKAGIYAYRLRDGKQVWAHAASADCADARRRLLVNCTTKYGYSAAPLVVDGAVVAGSLDGKLVVLDGATGKVLKSLDTAGPIKTVNGVAGQGGAIDAHALSAGAGTIFVGSGYGQFAQTPGNVLIALRPKR